MVAICFKIFTTFMGFQFSCSRGMKHSHFDRFDWITGKFFKNSVSDVPRMKHSRFSYMLHDFSTVLLL